MEIQTTNYTLTFIEIAEDCPADRGTIPPKKDETRSIAAMQFDLLAGNPYKYTSDDIIFRVFAERNDLTSQEQEIARKEFYSKGQACMRSSPLTKRYGWGIHHDEEGRIAIFGAETDEYQNFLKNPEIKKVKAMRTKRLR
jgi:hypothetical protein